MSELAPTGMDAHKPAEITRRIRLTGIAKAEMALVPLITLSILAGIFIGFGALFYTKTTSGLDVLYPPIVLLGGLAFSLGLILVVVSGAELFTGNTMIVMAVVDGKVSLAKLLRNWSIVLLGNLIGSMVILALVYWAGLFKGDVAERAMQVAIGKTSLTWVEAFCRGVLCNALVCLAVWMTVSARTTSGMIMAIVWPITGFVAMGMEHSVANMYMIPAGILSGADISFSAVLNNIFPVLLGNIVGGAGGVALFYRIAYGNTAAE
ncbi:formate/nitrite transporter family protein [Aliamphritea spongicola]|uniref:formate/nitrite transporter family protein n=1 Tax=Aliamphritea spongicola TaxID=707589 RepID=UPI00196B1688|nr:formate/nitrite transporter family protein [Aliamphritea spongicola]MBN3560766.1 formate/nitrite transporter family protein [Aliamphritea spongicola]